MTIVARKPGDRARRQRDRILRAAEQCFIDHGFHAATMAGIARAADISAGLIYRYFECKNAIVLAIIERQLEEKRANIATLQSEKDLGPRIRDLVAQWRAADPSVMNPRLFLEISAQAGRDAQVADAVIEADRSSRLSMSEWLRRVARRHGPGLSDAQTEARLLVLGCFVEGLAIRAVLDPAFDEATLEAALELFLPVVLSFGGPPAE